MQQLIPSFQVFENIFLGLAELAVLFLLVAAVRRRTVRVGPLLYTLLAIFLAHTALFMHPFPTPKGWNWEGKILSILVTLLCIAFFPGASWKDAGFTWKQNGGIAKACLAVAIFLIAAWGFQLLTHGIHFKMPDGPTIAFQATMPGFNEEPLYRGLALLLIDRAFLSEGIGVLGARLGWGALITAIWFGLIHGFGISDGGHLSFDLLTIAVVGVHGLFLAWIRVRTGSLVFGTLTHNIYNVGDQFIS
jgi:uncharacterized protein